MHTFGARISLPLYLFEYGARGTWTNVQIHTRLAEPWRHGHRARASPYTHAGATQPTDTDACAEGTHIDVQHRRRRRWSLAPCTASAVRRSASVSKVSHTHTHAETKQIICIQETGNKTVRPRKLPLSGSTAAAARTRENDQ